MLHPSLRTENGSVSSATGQKEPLRKPFKPERGEDGEGQKRNERVGSLVLAGTHDHLHRIQMPDDDDDDDDEGPTVRLATCSLEPNTG